MDRVRNYCNFSLCILLLQTEEVRNRSLLSVLLPRFSLKSKAGKGVLNSLCHSFLPLTLLWETLFASLSLCSFLCKMGIIIINAFSVLLRAE